ncbi:hypothetical protein M514_06236 [Trichuris suis]|uniref:Uncharacterized protein n=1 Tax=Trichuris suis TaxID=68888 RepID=A0A085M6T0_9BILA|nr:hypothetical protein M513_06236 [Trichuris suis]KFD63745.1 hypothetical protein M514_06236 [Trichuris suis]
MEELELRVFSERPGELWTADFGVLVSCELTHSPTCLFTHASPGILTMRSSTTATDGHEEPGRNHILSILQNSAYTFSLPRNSCTNLDNESLLGTEETLLMHRYVIWKFTSFAEI